MTQEKCLIIGAGGHCKVLLSLLFEDSLGYLPIGIIDEHHTKNEKILSISVVGGTNLLQKYFEEGVKFAFLAIGDNQKRKTMYDHIERIGFECPNLISKLANVSRTASLGKGNVICPFSNIGPSVEINNNNLINTHSNIEHETKIGSHCHIAPNATISGKSNLGDFIFLGTGSTVIERITISSNTFVAAGGVIVKDITENSCMYAGVPAKKIKKI